MGPMAKPKVSEEVIQSIADDIWMHYMNEQPTHQKGYDLALNYARKKKRGKSDRALAKSGVKNIIVTPIARELQNQCQAEVSSGDPYYFREYPQCRVPPESRDLAADWVLEHIEEYIPSIPEERLKIKRTRRG
jgi:hypothetical protein